jgi:hypothetical protein
VLSRPFWLSISIRTVSALSTKLSRIEKFASEIFYCKPDVLCCGAKGTHGFVRGLVKTTLGSTGSIVVVENPETDAGLAPSSTPKVTNA